MTPCFLLGHYSISKYFAISYQVGDDEFGHMLADILKQNNVDNSGMRFDHGARTALAFVTLRADGEREFLFFRHPSADMRLHESELDNNIIKQVFFLSAFLIFVPSSRCERLLVLEFSDLQKILIAGKDISLWFY